MDNRDFGTIERTGFTKVLSEPIHSPAIKFFNSLGTVLSFMPIALIVDFHPSVLSNLLPSVQTSPPLLEHGKVVPQIQSFLRIALTII